MRTVLVTGGSGGIGAAVARTLAEGGDRVALGYCAHGERALAIAESLRAQGRDARVFRADLTAAEGAEALFREVCAWAGRVDVLVNNAGTALVKLFSDCTEADYDRVMDLNFRAAVRLTKLVLPGMLARGYGKIVNVSSMWGKSGASCEALYSASKAALIGFTQALGKELARSGVAVNCVAPGVIDTEMNAALGPEALTELAEATPAGRLGRPEDVASCVKFLAGEESGFLVGQVLCPDGGFL